MVPPCDLSMYASIKEDNFGVQAETDNYENSDLFISKVIATDQKKIDTFITDSDVQKNQTNDKELDQFEGKSTQNLCEFVSSYY